MSLRDLPINLAKQFSPVCGDDILYDGYVPSSTLFEVTLIRVNFTCLILRHNVFHEGFVTFQQPGLSLSLKFTLQSVCVLRSLTGNGIRTGCLYLARLQTLFSIITSAWCTCVWQACLARETFTSIYLR